MNEMELAKKIETRTRNEELKTMARELREREQKKREICGDVNKLAKKIEESAHLLEHSNDSSIPFEKSLKAHPEFVRELRERANPDKRLNEVKKTWVNEKLTEKW